MFVPLLFANSPPIVYRLQNDQEIQNIVGLEINPEILFVDDKKVSDKNVSVNNDCKVSDDLNEILPRIRWDLINLQPYKTFEYRGDKERHLRGAEVLVKDWIPPQFIKGVHVHWNYDYAEDRANESARKSGRSVRVVKSMFDNGVKTMNLFLQENE